MHPALATLLLALAGALAAQLVARARMHAIGMGVIPIHMRGNGPSVRDR